MQENPFKFLESFEPSQVASLLEGELAFIQGAALCLLPPVASARILACMDDKRRRDVAGAMSKSRQMPPDVLRDIADELQKKTNPWDGRGPATAPATRNEALGIPEIDPEHEAEKLVEQEMKKQNLSHMLSKLAGKGLATAKPAKQSGPREFAASIRPPEAVKPKKVIQDIPQAKEKPGSSLSRREQVLAQAMDKVRNKKQASRHRAIPDASRGQQNMGRGAPTQGGNKMAGAKSIDGMALMAHILREADPSVRKLVSNELPGLYEELHGQMFDFADLEHSDAKTLGMVFTGVDAETAALALRFASDTLKQKAFEAMSKRKADMINDEISAATGKKIKLSDIDEAQQRVIDFAVKLQDKGQVVIDPDDPQLL